MSSRVPEISVSLSNLRTDIVEPLMMLDEEWEKVQKPEMVMAAYVTCQPLSDTCLKIGKWFYK